MKSTWIRRIGLGVLAYITLLFVVAQLLRFVPIDEERRLTDSRLVGIHISLEDWRDDHGRYPTQAEGLGVLLSPIPEPVRQPRFLDVTYLESPADLADAWGRPIIYHRLTDQRAPCMFYSLGADGALGGGGSNEDLVFACGFAAK